MVMESAVTTVLSVRGGLISGPGPRENTLARSRSEARKVEEDPRGHDASPG
jgi:hypothetical protein